ncbi:hypothetical protein, partial [Chromobacterium phragmitis]|uniref:hypothetical protein n=1 Tax=Chromobacterium phragmitis TaxID=2202141 RepID=UPI00387805D5
VPIAAFVTPENRFVSAVSFAASAEEANYTPFPLFRSLRQLRRRTIRPGPEPVNTFCEKKRTFFDPPAQGIDL